MKYKLDGAKDISDRDSEFSSDLFYNATEEDDNLLDDENTILNKDKNYFGQDAKSRFWKLYKSDRTFKDQDNTDIKDPRFAFIKTWHEMGMLPKAGMIIRSEKTSHLSFANLGLLQKNSVAVAESLKRYPLEIEALDFTGNGIRPKECTLLAQAIEVHANSLVQLNFSENKIGLEGWKALGEALLKMKLLEVINLSGNLLGDDAINEIVKGMSSLINIKWINFSNNALGRKASDSEFMENLCLILKNTGSLTELNLSWNNFRGEVAEKLILSMKENYTVK